MQLYGKLKQNILQEKPSHQKKMVIKLSIYFFHTFKTIRVC